MIVQEFYYDPCILKNSVIANTDEGFYLLREDGIFHLTEKPPSLLKLDLFKERFLLKKKNNAHPHSDHLSGLHSAYASKLDTIFFFENGAVIKLLHRNSCMIDLHFASRSVPEPAPVFFSALEAEKLGILKNSIANSPFYSEFNYDSQAFAEPVETAYIVYPGWLQQNESYLFSDTCLRNNILSADFIMNYLNPERNPIQFSQFWQIPSLFCLFTHAFFDHDTWNSHIEKDYLPEYNVHTFSLHNECIAEIICVDTFCDPGYFPYHDSFTLTLNYQETFDSEVRRMIHLLLNQYDNIIPVPPHLCGEHER